METQNRNNFLKQNKIKIMQKGLGLERTRMEK